MGGDEFAIILEFITDLSQATRIAQKIIDNMAPPFELAGESLHVTMSIGISAYPKSKTARALLKDADIAMYQAKREGRNTFRVFKNL
jgi:diguanylate cyclase (GGDEF)-like protein